MPAGDSVISATADRIRCAAAVLLAVQMVILDMTVINVSLPYMMGTLGATPDQITWVLTSYIVAEGVVIPISGFLAERFGLCTDSLESCRVEGRAGREDKGRPSSLRGQLCLLSWRRRSWQHGDGRAKPYRQVLDLWRRCADHRHHGSERPSGPHADLGRSTVAARPQDSHSLCFRSERDKSMSENIAVSSTALTKARLWLFVGLGLLLMAIANWHLVYMAITSEPACVAHVRQGEGTAQPGRFSAAQSSCSPR